VLRVCLSACVFICQSVWMSLSVLTLWVWVQDPCAWGGPQRKVKTFFCYKNIFDSLAPGLKRVPNKLYDLCLTDNQKNKKDEQKRVRYVCFFTSTSQSIRPNRLKMSPNAKKNPLKQKKMCRSVCRFPLITFEEIELFTSNLVHRWVDIHMVKIVFAPNRFSGRGGEDGGLRPGFSNECHPRVTLRHVLQYMSQT